MNQIKHWYAVIRMALLDAEEDYLKRKATNKGGMKYEKTPVRRAK